VFLVERLARAKLCDVWVNFCSATPDRFSNGQKRVVRELLLSPENLGNPGAKDDGRGLNGWLNVPRKTLMKLVGQARADEKYPEGPCPERIDWRSWVGDRWNAGKRLIDYVIASYGGTGWPCSPNYLPRASTRSR